MNFKNYLKQDYTALCDVCKRNQGFNPNNDDLWLCKYGCHKLGDIDVKCKYFKRIPKYHTCKNISKTKKIYKPNKLSSYTKVSYKNGKFIRTELAR